MTPEELYGRAMLALARSERHKPMHNVIGGNSIGGKKGGKRGQTAERIRELAAQGLNTTEIAAALDLSRKGVWDSCKRHGIVIQREDAA